MRTFLILIVLSGLLLNRLGAEDKAKPNIIMILSDDVGLGDVHFSGGRYNTPHIDALAKNGINFPLCYSTPLCGPSRCQLLTGRYPFRTGLISNQSDKALADHKEIMIQNVMKKAGYATGCVGKWGQMPFGPADWGFDESLSYHGSGRYWNQQTETYVENGKQKKLADGEYLPDLMQKFISTFLEKHKSEPFFLYYPMTHIHGPIVKTPDSKPGDDLYAKNIEYMDKLVGQLMDELDKQKLRENTIVIFTGDNGTARFGDGEVDGKEESGKKASMLEGGSRVPLAVSWPGHTPAGTTCKDLIDFSDFFATFAELGGAQLPEGVKLDSHSFAAQIKGEKGTPREWAYVELNGNSYARDARYKLTNHGELFDLIDAPFKEVPVPADTAIEGAITSRKTLQAILDEHTAAPGGKEKVKKKNKKKNQNQEEEVQKVKV